MKKRFVSVQPDSRISFGVAVKVSIEELQKLSPMQCKAFMAGVAEVLKASPSKEAL